MRAIKIILLFYFIIIITIVGFSRQMCKGEGTNQTEWVALEHGNFLLIFIYVRPITLTMRGIS